MDVTDRDLAFLRLAADHYCVTAEQLRAHASPGNTDTTVVRRRLRLLHAAGLIGIARAEALTVNNAVHSQVYYPTQPGMLELARRTGEMKWVLTPTRPPYAHHLAHFLALTDLRLLVKAAVASQSVCQLGDYFNQFDAVNPDAEDPERRFKLYTAVQTHPRKVACVPDAGFALRAGSVSKAYYVELERGTTPPSRAAAKKSPGYAGLADGRLHLRHFPDALREFSVLVLAPHPGWRDQLRKEFAKRPHPELYKFASLTEVTPETFLFSPVWHPCSGAPHALLKRPQPVPEGVPGGVSAGAHPGTPALPEGA